MRATYDDRWMGIRFADLPLHDRGKVPGTDFYESFYTEFHRRYSGWTDLDAEWRSVKEEVADLVVRRAGWEERILSVGCGIGYVEKCVVERGFRYVDVQETDSSPLKWLERILPPESMRIGRFPDCLDADRRYDLILLSAVDYCFDSCGWIAFLRSIRTRLVRGGRCLVVSPSAYRPTVLGLVRSLATRTLEVTGLTPPRQRWGWGRTRADHRHALRSAGFSPSEEAFLPGGPFWIEGRSPPDDA